MDNEEFVAAAAAAPVITALVAAIGQALPALPRRTYPIVSVLLGLGWATIAASARGDMGWPLIIEGIVVGLTASGLYSAAVKPLSSLRDA